MQHDVADRVRDAVDGGLGRGNVDAVRDRDQQHGRYDDTAGATATWRKGRQYEFPRVRPHRRRRDGAMIWRPTDDQEIASLIPDLIRYFCGIVKPVAFASSSVAGWEF